MATVNIAFSPSSMVLSSSTAVTVGSGSSSRTVVVTRVTFDDCVEAKVMADGLSGIRQLSLQLLPLLSHLKNETTTVSSGSLIASSLVFTSKAWTIEPTSVAHSLPAIGRKSPFGLE